MRGFILAVCVVGVAAMGSAQSFRDSGEKVAADPIVGEWIWMGDMRVSVHPDGTATNRTGDVSATWKFLQNKEVERKYEFTWIAQGRVIIDRLTLSRDTQKLDGKNQSGFRFSAKRAAKER